MEREEMATLARLAKARLRQIERATIEARSLLRQLASALESTETSKEETDGNRRSTQNLIAV